MKEKTEKTEPEKIEKAEKPEPSEPTLPAETTKADVSPQAAVSPLPPPSEKPEPPEPTLTAETTKADASPQAAVSPLPPPSDQPTTTVPSYSELVNKACQSLNDLEDSDIQAITKFATSLLEDIEKGKLRKSNVKALLRSLHYDRDIAAANKEGEIKGRNAKIEELMAERERTAKIHMPTGARNSLHTPPSHVIGGLAAADRRTIWERGNEKRTVY